MKKEYSWILDLLIVVILGIVLFQLTENVPAPKPGLPNTASGEYSAFPYLPRRDITPGAVMPGITKEHICKGGYSASVRNVSNSTKKQLFDTYGVVRTPGEYEIDHLISLELGGDNVKENLWPQSYITPKWNAHVKDRLENKLHSMICKGEISLEEAQKDIAENWILAYKKYIGEPKD